MMRRRRRNRSAHSGRRFSSRPEGEGGNVSHRTVRGAYEELAERINLLPQGAPPSELLFRILAMLFQPDEARKVARLPVRPFGVERAQRAWTCSEAEALGLLDRLAARGLLVDYEWEGRRQWVLPPPMAGFFEFSMMRCARRHRPEGPGRASLRVSERGRRVRHGAVRARGDPARAGLRGGGPPPRGSPRGARLGAGRAASSRRPIPWPWASVTAATRCATSERPATGPWTCA